MYGKNERFRLQITRLDGQRYWEKFEHEHEVLTAAQKRGGRPERYDPRKGCWCLMLLPHERKRDDC